MGARLAFPKRLRRRLELPGGTTPVTAAAVPGEPRPAEPGAYWPGCGALGVFVPPGTPKGPPLSGTKHPLSSSKTVGPGRAGGVSVPSVAGAGPRLLPAEQAQLRRKAASRGRAGTGRGAPGGGLVGPRTAAGEAPGGEASRRAEGGPERSGHHGPATGRCFLGGRGLEALLLRHVCRALFGSVCLLGCLIG